MSVIDFFIGIGGTASQQGGFPEEERNECNSFIKKFCEKLAKLKSELQIPISQLSIFKMNYLYVGKDTSDYHFVFIDQPGENRIFYQDLSVFGKVSTDELIHRLKIEVGDVNSVISTPIRTISSISDVTIEEYAKQHIRDTKQKTQKITDDAVANPEIAREIEAFKADHKEKTAAFIIMQFSNTPAHAQIVSTIKETLGKHDIVGLRADDKEYVDDLFTNIKVYMHCCDFGIGVFERILEDNFNPNVSIEVGYMMGLNRKVCLLKDKTLKNLPTDLMGKLYKPFDPQDIGKTLPNQLEKWMKDKGIIEGEPSAGSKRKR